MRGSRCDKPIGCTMCIHSSLQLSYADMLKRVDPLRSELKALEERAETTRIKGEEMKKIIFELEESIAKYKEEYAVLISEANAIKADLSTVEAKVRGRRTWREGWGGDSEWMWEGMPPASHPRSAPLSLIAAQCALYSSTHKVPRISEC